MSEPSGTQYGGFWIRLLAFVADSAILFLISAALLAGASMFLGPDGLIPAAFAAAAIAFLYWPVMHASGMQATPGKAIVGLKVARLDGRRISIIRSLWREIAKVFSAALAMLGYLMAMVMPRKQALHDLLAATYVVKEGASGVVPALAVAVAGFAIPIFAGPMIGTAELVSPLTRMAEGLVKEHAPQFAPTVKNALQMVAPEPAPAPKPRPVRVAKASVAAPKPAPTAEPAKIPSAPKAEAPKPEPAKPPVASAPAPTEVAKTTPAPEPEAPKPEPAKPPVVTAAPSAKAAKTPTPSKLEPAPTAVAQALPEKPKASPAKARAAPTKTAPAKPKSSPTRAVAQSPQPAAVPPSPPKTASGMRYNDVMTAVLYRDVDAVKELLKLGKWVDKPDSQGATPLMVAAQLGDVRMAEALLRAGADARRAVPVAEGRGDAEMLQLLKRYK